METMEGEINPKEISRWVLVAESDQFEKTVRRKVVTLADPISTFAGKIHRITHRPQVLVNSFKEGRDPISDRIKRMTPPHRTEFKGVMEGILLAAIVLGSGTGVFKVVKHCLFKKQE